MAKKKPTLQHSHNLKQQHQQQQHKEENQPSPSPPPTPTPPPPPSSTVMDDTSVQIQNLKSLNSMLLKETAEKRHQLESLTDAKRALQSKLDTCVARNDAVLALLLEATDKNAALEMERRVLLVVAEVQMGEMGPRFDDLVAERDDMERVVSERERDAVVLEREVRELNARAESERAMLSRVSEERDRLKSELECVVGEAERLREKVLEGEERERSVREEVEKLRLEREGLLGEEKEREAEIEELRKERDSALRTCEESGCLVERLKEEIDAAVREKSEIEKVKNDNGLRIVGLELEVKKLNESLKDLRDEEVLMRGRICELEGSLGAAMAKGEEMEMEVRALVQEKEDMEKRIEVLNGKRDGVEKVLDMVRKELEVKQREIHEAIRAKDVVEQVKALRESEAEELQREVDRLRDVVVKLRGFCREFEEKNAKLIAEAEHYRGSVDEAVVEKDNIRQAFEGEKSKVENLMLQVAGMEGKFEQTAVELDNVRSEREKLVEKIKMMESRVGVLVNEKDAMQRSLMEAQRESDDLRAKVEFYRINSSMALAMLKNTAAALVCKNTDGVVEEVVHNAKNLEEDMQPFAEELDAIRNAFKSKDEMVDDMKQQLESLRKSVADAHKNKNLWTVISSATTIFAAAIAAYAARGR